jgi:hypothetical protein
MNFIVLQGLPSMENQFEKLQNPILGILLISLLGFIIFLIRANRAKDIYIKELNAAMLAHAVKNLEVITSLKDAIKSDDNAHRILEEVIRENNNLLKTLIRDLERKN